MPIKILLPALLQLFIAKHSSANPNEALCMRTDEELTSMFFWDKRISTMTDEGWAESDFISMLGRGSVFVDKSLLIKRILETKEKVLLINAPSKSGKSVNLSMLKNFFEIRVHKETEAIYPRTQSSIYSLFTQGTFNSTIDLPLQHMYVRIPSKMEYEEFIITATLTKPFLISNYTDIVDQHLGMYPVIHLRLSMPLMYPELETITQELKARLCYYFQRGQFLHQMISRVIYENTTEGLKTKISPNLQKRFEFYADKCFTCAPFTATDMEDSILFVSEVMHEVFGKPVIILMDDGYSKRFKEDLFEKYQLGRDYTDINITEVQYGINLLRRFMKRTLADNPYLMKAVLMDTFSINRKDIFADVTDIVHYNAIHNELYEFFGYTETEVEMLFEYFETDPKEAEKARQFYKGYTMKRNADVTVYNMISMAKFLKKRTIKSDWIEHQIYNEKVTDWLDVGKIRDVLEQLINGTDRMIYFTEVDYDSKELLISTKCSDRVIFNVTEKAANHILSLLYEIGFFTNSNNGKRTSRKSHEIYIRIANEEIRQGLIKMLKDSVKLFHDDLAPILK